MSHSIPLGIVTHVHAASSSSGSGSSGSSSSSGTDSSSSSSATAAGLAALPANMQISQTGFLQLISTQMQNQDPLNPTDPTQFLAQIEGLSEVSSLQSLQSSISGLASGLQASQVISGTSLLGHSVLAPGSTANIAAGGTVSGAVSAPSGASSLAVSVTSSSGALVNSFSVSPQASGYTPISWNGTTSTGAAAPAGQYTIGVNAQVGNATQSVSPLLYSQVTSVTIDPSTQALDLNTNNGTIPLSSVVNIQ
jgi:flagellar basal-body rod modification protein FlgD